MNDAVGRAEFDELKRQVQVQKQRIDNVVDSANKALEGIRGAIRNNADAIDGLRGVIINNAKAIENLRAALANNADAISNNGRSIEVLRVAINDLEKKLIGFVSNTNEQIERLDRKIDGNFEAVAGKLDEILRRLPGGDEG